MTGHSDTCDAFWRAGLTYGPCLCGTDPRDSDRRRRPRREAGSGRKPARA